MKRRIVQIMPADGWRARFAEKADGREWDDPLVCWALVEDEQAWQEVVGMVAADPVEFCDTFDQFLGYMGPGETSDEASDG